MLMPKSLTRSLLAAAVLPFDLNEDWNLSGADPAVTPSEC
jgi:hypothetical protein